MCSDVELFKRLFNAGLNDKLFQESVEGASSPKLIFTFTRDWYLRDGSVPSRAVLESDDKFEQFFSVNEVPHEVDYQPEYVVKYLKNNAVKANVQGLIRDANDKIFDSDADQVDELGAFHRELSKLYIDVASTGDQQDISQAAPEVVASLFERARDAEGYRDSLVKFPFNTMNDYFFGLRPREYALFFGYTGDMKSLTLEYATLLNAQAGKRVAHFTLENGIETTTIRFLAFLSHIPMARLQGGGVMPKEMEALQQAKNMLASLPILLDQSAGVEERSVESIFTKARAYNADLVVIDQATWVTAPDVRRQSTWEVVQEISRRVKTHTNELGVATIMASQANRESQKTKKGTGLAHIAGSDDLTKTATLAASLDFDKDSGLLKVAVVKNRNGSANLEFTMNVELDTQTQITLNQIVSS